MKKYIYTLTLCIFFHAAFVTAQPGSLDSSFSHDGKLITRFSGIANSEAHSIAVQSDKKIIIAGESARYNTAVFGLIRLNSKGGRDKSFGTNGEVTTDFGTGNSFAQSVIIQANGMIVAGGISYYGSVMARYKKNGELDSSFGLKGKIANDFGGTYEGIYSLALQKDGKIVATGIAGDHVALARYKQNGTRDSSFGINGLVLTDLGNNFSFGRAVAIQTDGKIVVAGLISDAPQKSDALLLRYKSNGQPDSSFGNKGIGVVVTNLGSIRDTYTSLAISLNEKIIVAGFEGDYAHGNFVLAQYNKNGTLNKNFGTDGITITDFDNTNDEVNALALEFDGKIVVAGTLQYKGSHNDLQPNFALARYTRKGNIDSTFGTNGKTSAIFDGTSPEIANAVAIQTDGKILLAGMAERRVAIARFNADSSNLHFNKNSIFQPIKQENTTTISLSPNPVKDMLYLQGMSSLKKTISLINTTGIVLQKIITANSNYTISTKQLTAGIYFIKITEGDKTTTLKFAKQ